MAVLTAAQRALLERAKNRNLPGVDIPQVEGDDLARTLHGIQEHLRMYEGDSGAPKERFVTIAELENTGLIKSDVKSRFAYISQVLGTDVAQMAGSTANPTQIGSVKNDTSRTSRTKTSGSSAGSGSTASSLKLNDASDVNFGNPAQNDFLFFDGNTFTTTPLFRTTNVWQATNQFGLPIALVEQENGPTAVPGLGYVWVKADSPNTLWFTDDDGTETQLGAADLSGYTQAAVDETITENWTFAPTDGGYTTVANNGNVNSGGLVIYNSSNTQSTAETAMNGWQFRQGQPGNYDGYLLVGQTGSNQLAMRIASTGDVSFPYGMTVDDNKSFGSASSGAIAYYMPYDTTGQHEGKDMVSWCRRHRKQSHNFSFGSYITETLGTKPDRTQADYRQRLHDSR